MAQGVNPDHHHHQQQQQQQQQRRKSSIPNPIPNPSSDSTSSASAFNRKRGVSNDNKAADSDLIAAIATAGACAAGSEAMSDTAKLESAKRRANNNNNNTTNNAATEGGSNINKGRRSANETVTAPSVTSNRDGQVRKGANVSNNKHGDNPAGGRDASSGDRKKGSGGRSRGAEVNTHANNSASASKKAVVPEFNLEADFPVFVSANCTLT